MAPSASLLGRLTIAAELVVPFSELIQRSAKGLLTGHNLADRLFDSAFGRRNNAMTAARAVQANGGLAQLGERLNGIQKVAGSIPVSSTSQPLAPQGVASFLDEPKPTEVPMSAAAWRRVACFLTLLLLVEVKVSFAGSEEKKKEVDFPKLPAGAGKIDKDAPKAFTETKSGLRYRVLRPGKGQKPKATDTVKVHYQGWLDGGKVFDSSYKRKEPISFPLNHVIKGWTEGMQLVDEGGMIELEIPAKLGYGDRGVEDVIPKGAKLHFLVELLKIE
jgi:FKBP-type peptidyl-prolyl cis-trans isomerase FkpA